MNGFCIGCGIVLPFGLLALAWCAHRIRKGNRQLTKLRNTLQAATLKNQRLKKDQNEKETQRRETEEKLRGYLRLLDALINTMSNPVCFKDAQGVFQGCNKVFADHVMGLTRDRIIGKRTQELPDQIPPELAAALQRQERITMDKGGHHCFETQMRCADGIHRDFLFNLAPIRNRKAESIGCVAVLSDLTEKNLAARDRMRRERLEGVLETAGGVCHEFNQPLQAISGYLEMLAVKIHSPSEALALLGKAMAQIDRMGQITAKLQGITHYETMDYAGNMKIIDIHKASGQAVRETGGDAN